VVQSSVPAMDCSRALTDYPVTLRRAGFGMLLIVAFSRARPTRPAVWVWVGFGMLLIVAFSVGLAAVLIAIGLLMVQALVVAGMLHI
jgi:hypothetical protein